MYGVIVHKQEHKEQDSLFPNSPYKHILDKDVKSIPIFSLPLQIPLRLEFCPGKPVEIIKACSEHPVYVIMNFLTDQECDEIVKVGSPRLRPSTTVEDGKLVVAKYRSSWTAFLNRDGKSSDNWAVHNFQKRASMFSGMPISQMEAVNLVRYKNGEQYEGHRDYFSPESTNFLDDAGQRTMTFFAYLNDVPKKNGGKTVFNELGFKVIPIKGACVFWLDTSLDGKTCYTNTLHAGGKIKGDIIKYGSNLWIREKPFH